MRARLSIVLLAAGISLTIACGDDGEPAGPAERGAAIALEIQANPDEAEAILEDHEMTIEELEALMYAIAADPELSQRYQELLEAEE